MYISKRAIIVSKRVHTPHISVCHVPSITFYEPCDHMRVNTEETVRLLESGNLSPEE